MGKMRHRTIAAAAMMLAACGRADIGNVEYSHDQCRRIELVDAQTGWRLRGVEDIVFDADGGRLFLSAYDRRAVESAARRRADALPNGGVYVVGLGDLDGAGANLVLATPLISPADIAGGLRPHGLAFDARAHELVFINRTYERVGNVWRMTPKIQRVGANGEAFVGKAGNAPCAANNVVVVDGATLTTFDHGACNWRGGLENLLALKRSGIEGDGLRFDRAGFANGAATTLDGDIVLAATREHALIALTQDGEELVETMRIALPGGPDNLSVTAHAQLIAAVHPSLLRLALSRKFGIGKAPSRIVKVDLARGASRVLFDDPRGAVFAAATIGVEIPAGLLVGSVTDRGVLLCREDA